MSATLSSWTCRHHLPRQFPDSKLIMLSLGHSQLVSLNSGVLSHAIVYSVYWQTEKEHWNVEFSACYWHLYLAIQLHYKVIMVNVLSLYRTQLMNPNKVFPLLSLIYKCFLELAFSKDPLTNEFGSFRLNTSDSKWSAALLLGILHKLAWINIILLNGYKQCL